MSLRGQAVSCTTGTAGSRTARRPNACWRRIARALRATVAGRDPGREIGDLILAQRLVRRHRRNVVGTLDRLEQQALVRLASDNGRAGITAGEQRLARVDAQFAGHFLIAVAAKARAGHNGVNLLVEQAQAGRGRRIIGGRRTGEHDRKHHRYRRPDEHAYTSASGSSASPKRSWGMPTLSSIDR